MTRLIELITTDPTQTRAVAQVVAGVVVGGDVIALTGELGAGKTCFVQGAAAALGVTERVTSPSFLLRKDYRGRLDVMHLDVYRLETLQQALEIGFDDALAGEGVAFVEWGDAMAPLLPPDHLEVELRLPPLDPELGLPPADAGSPAADGAEPRTVTLRAHGHGWTRRLAEMEPALRRWLPANGVR